MTDDKSHPQSYFFVPYEFKEEYFNYEVVIEEPTPILSKEEILNHFKGIS
jgi:hypothetical protein